MITYKTGQRYGRDKWSVGETHSITFGETLRERWWTFMYDRQWEQKTMAMIMRKIN